MKWLLIAIVMNTPVKTDLVFESLADCLRAEETMRQQWADVYNDAAKRRAEKATLDLLLKQQTFGTCVPSR